MKRIPYLVASSILIIVLLVLVNNLVASHWQLALLQPEKNLVQPKTTKVLAVLLKQQQATKNISFSDVTLPPLPIAATKPRVKTKPDVLKKNSESSKNELVVPMRQSTTQMYQQLISDSAIDIEIAWPDQVAARARLFDYLYRCAGMQIGVMNGSSITVVNKQSHQPRSAWLRVAQGQLNTQEIKWLRQSPLSGIPVRLFPKVIDWQLAQQIAQYLGNKKLQSFRARYGLNQQGLYLDDIWLNAKPISVSWQLNSISCNL